MPCWAFKKLNLLTEADMHLSFLIESLKPSLRLQAHERCTAVPNLDLDGLHFGSIFLFSFFFREIRQELFLSYNKIEPLSLQYMYMFLFPAREI